MTAALKATEAGASVILLEKEDVLGGNTRLGSSVFNAAGSTMQQEAGTEGATAEAFAEKLTASNTAADPEAIRILAENSGAAPIGSPPSAWIFRACSILLATVRLTAARPARSSSRR